MDVDSPPTYEKRKRRPVDEDDLLELDLTLASSQESSHESSQESPPKRLKFSDDETQTPMDLDASNFEGRLTRKPRSILQMPFNERELGIILGQFLGYPEDIALRLLATKENPNYLLDMFAQENGWFGDPTSSQLIKSSVSFLGNFDAICNMLFCPALTDLLVELELLKILFRLWNPGYDHTEDHTGMKICVCCDDFVVCVGTVTGKASPPETYCDFINFDLNFGNLITSVLPVEHPHIHIRKKGFSFPVGIRIKSFCIIP
jgi:hypothetical protein